MAQALRPHGRQEGGADRAGRGQDQGGLLGADQSRRPGFWRAPTRARSTTSTRRCAAPKHFVRAGADGIFIEAPRSVEELEIIGKAFDVPQICNPLMGGHTPILSMDELDALGFNCAVLGLDTVMHAAKAVEAVLLDMKSGKFALRNSGMNFEEYKKVVGYDKWESVDERFAP